MNSTNISAILSERNFSCRQQKLICLQFYVPPLQVIAWLNIALNALLSLTAVFGNGLIFAAYYQKQSLRRPANTILLSLAATDFLTGATVQPLYIYETLLVMFGDCDQKVCTVVNISRPFMLFLMHETLFNLALITLDRYIAICHSYRYVELVTNSRVKKVLAIVWLIGVICASLKRIRVPMKFTLGIQLFIFCSSVIVIVFFYLKVYREIRRLEGQAVVALNEPEEEIRARERKRAKTAAIVIGLLALCFFPIILTGILYISLPSHQLSSFAGEILFLFSRTAVFSNSSFNFLIYYWRNEEMRKAMLTVIKKITQRAVQPN